MQIIYIDDDYEDQEIFKEAIQSIDSNIVCYFYKSAVEAISFLKELAPLPDFVFVDVNMPAMTGKEFLRELKHTARLRPVPIIMFSTTFNPREINEYLQLGAKDFIVKPASFDKLCEILRTILVR
jgi:CheY-like chemotaxis protein